MVRRIVIPRVNANDDQVLIVALHADVGDEVREGDLLAEVETTKATAEILAPRSGRVQVRHGQQGQYMDVGVELFVLSSGEPEAEAKSADPVSGGGREQPVVTAKARRLSESLGIDPDALAPDSSGRVTVEVVENSRKRSSDTGRGLGVTEAVVLGGGGHAAAVIDALSGQGIRVVGCIDDNDDLLGQEVLPGVRVVGNRDALRDLRVNGVGIAYVGYGGIGAGAIDATETRARIFQFLCEEGFVLPPLVSRSAYIGLNCQIGPGTVVMPGAVVGARCRIGSNVVVNQGAQICHDTIVGDHAHVTPSAVIGGNCTLGRGSVIGMGASVLLDVVVGDFCLIHNNASISTNVDAHSEVYSDGRRFTRSPEVSF